MAENTQNQSDQEAQNKIDQFIDRMATLQAENEVATGYAQRAIDNRISLEDTKDERTAINFLLGDKHEDEVGHKYLIPQLYMQNVLNFKPGGVTEQDIKTLPQKSEEERAAIIDKIQSEPEFAKYTANAIVQMNQRDKVKPTYKNNLEDSIKPLSEPLADGTAGMTKGEILKHLEGQLKSENTAFLEHESKNHQLHAERNILLDRNQLQRGWNAKDEARLLELNNAIYDSDEFASLVERPLADGTAQTLKVPRVQYLHAFGSVEYQQEQDALYAKLRPGKASDALLGEMHRTLYELKDNPRDSEKLRQFENRYRSTRGFFDGDDNQLDPKESENFEKAYNEFTDGKSPSLRQAFSGVSKTYLEDIANSFQKNDGKLSELVHKYRVTLDTDNNKTLDEVDQTALKALLPEGTDINEVAGKINEALRGSKESIGPAVEQGHNPLPSMNNAPLSSGNKSPRAKT